MKTAVIYYSWSGHTAQLAKTRAEKEEAQLIEVKDMNRPGTLKAYTAGCFAAMRMKQTAIMPLATSLGDFEKIIIMAPVWAGHPAPAVNNIFDMLPRGKAIEVIMVSGSGSCGCKEKVQALITAKGCKMTAFENIKG